MIVLIKSTLIKGFTTDEDVLFYLDVLNVSNHITSAVVIAKLEEHI